MSSLNYTEEIARFNPTRKTTHRCKVCKFWTTSMLTMINHVKRHQEGLQLFNCSNLVENYSCGDCDVITDYSMILKKHLQQFHVKKEDFREVQCYLCRDCDFETCFALECLRHALDCPSSGDNFSKQKLKVDANLYCNKCNFHMKSKLDILDHKKNKHSRESELKFKCVKCPFRAKYQLTVACHMARRHLNKYVQQTYFCDKCNYNTKKKSYFKFHTKNKHVGEAVSWYNCDICDFKTTRKLNLERHHSKMHLNPIVWFQCQECEYKTKRESCLPAHMKNKHSKKWVQCEKCEYKTKTKKSLKTHMKRHLKKQLKRMETQHSGNSETF